MPARPMEGGGGLRPRPRYGWSYIILPEGSKNKMNEHLPPAPNLTPEVIMIVFDMIFGILIELFRQQMFAIHTPKSMASSALRLVSYRFGRGR